MRRVHRHPSAPAKQERYSALDLIQAQGTVRASIDTVVTLSRAVLLTTDVSQSAIIGPEGGTLEIAASGGWNVAYEFAPHGITFAVPVMVEQSLGNLLAGGGARALQAGYYQDDLGAVLVDTRQSLARVTELRQVLLDRPTDPRVARFFISHFSGYIMSSGFASGGGGGSDGGDPGSGQP